MTKPRLIISAPERWADESARLLINLLTLKLGADTNRRVSVALSGGSTPAALYRSLAQDHGATIDWSRLDLFLSDERMVPLEHEESNYHTAKRLLVEALPGKKPLLHPVATDLSPEDAARDYEFIMREKVSCTSADGTPCLDVILLGMGADGHTASLFPDAVSLDESTRLVVPAVQPASGQDRVTFTLSLIAQAASLLFLVTGTKKAEMMARVMSEPPSSDRPISLVAQTHHQAVWLLDSDAAANLPVSD